MSKTIRVLLAEDQTMIRGALAALLSLEEDIRVIAQAADGREALDWLAAHQADTPVDVALLDIEMPVLDGISAASSIRDQYPDIATIIVTTFGRPGFLRRAFEAGARGFVVKDAPAAQLAAAIRAVVAGNRVVDPQLAVESITTGVSPLSERETEVLRLVSQGMALEQIADDLCVSYGTVRNHISSAIAKTATHNRSEAVAVATKYGWL